MLNIGGLQEGVVIDHIKAGGSMEIYHYLELEKLDCSVAIIKNAKSSKMGKKDIIKIEGGLDLVDLDVLGFIDHNITVNIIKDGKIVALAKDGTLVLDVKDSKAKAQTAYNNVAIYNDKGEVAQTITAQDNNVVITAGDKTETIDNAAIVLKDTTKKKVNLSMVHVIQIFMLLAGALIVIFTKTDAGKISKNEIFRSGMIALVAVFGISWMAETMFTVHTPMMKAALGDVVKAHPWTYAVMLLLISKFVNSQAAALVAFVPLALGIGVDPAVILAFASACYGYYILPTYPSDLAAIQFDRSGTTHIGKFVINHSFILPGLIGVITSCIFGYIFTSLFGYL